MEKDVLATIIAAVTERDFRIDVVEKGICGLHYMDITFYDPPVRKTEEQGYDEYLTSPYLDETTMFFEKLPEAMLTIAEYEAKLRRLGDEVVKATRRYVCLRSVPCRTSPGR